MPDRLAQSHSIISCFHHWARPHTAISRGGGGMVIVGITLVLSVVVAQAATSEPLLVVIGDVSESAARILYDALDRTLPGTNVEARLYDDNGDVVFQEALVIGEGPRIWRLSNLIAGQHYRVQLQTAAGDTSSGRFRTWSSPDPSIRILASSCNNFLEDNDDSFLAELLQNDLVQDRFGMIHLGDQLYADFIYHDWDRTGRRMSHDDLVEQYRNAYRTIWSKSSMRSLLSTGANWMVIDDHDIVNNIDPDQLRDGREPLLRAGRRAYLEYQLQLQFDIFDEIGREIVSQRSYYTKTIGSLAFVFLDTHLERTFNFDPDAPFLGAQQMEKVFSSLSSLYHRSDISKIVLVSSVPLMWAPSTWVSMLPDIVEKEKMALHPVHRQETLELLSTASQYTPKLMLLSGDIHLFLQGQVCSRSRPDRPCIEQVTTSGLTVGSTAENSLKLLGFHFLSLGVGSNVIGDWAFVTKKIHLGHNAVLIESTPRNFHWIPIFSQNTSLWRKVVQFLFVTACSLSKYAVLIALCMTFLCVLFYATTGRIKRKAKNAKIN